jgi:nucleotide-binding universal stress UspA family protein
MYEKILLPLDGSELSHQALPHVGALANAFGAQVLLLQVVDSVAQIIAETTPATIEPIPSGELTVEIAESAVEGQRAAAQANLEDGVDRLVAAGVDRARVTTLVIEGQPAHAITEQVKEHGCDLVVIATHGRSGLGRVLLGSVADHVARHTPNAAVLLIRPQD